MRHTYHRPALIIVLLMVSLGARNTATAQEPIQITVPRADTTLAPGVRTTIRWTPSTSSPVSLSLSADDGATWTPIEARGTGGHHDWTVPNRPLGRAAGEPLSVALLAGSNAIDIDLTSLAPGLYFARIGRAVTPLIVE